MRYKLGLGSAENAAEKKPAKLCHPLCQCEKCVLIKEVDVLQDNHLFALTFLLLDVELI